MPCPDLLAVGARRSARWLPRLLACAALLATPLAAATTTLRVLAWPGYADPEAVRQFEARFDAHVEVTQVDSDEVLWQTLTRKGGAHFDVFAVNTAELARYIDAGIAAPVNENAIPNIARQLPRFRDARQTPGLFRGKQRYAVPYTWAEMGLIYDRQRLSTPPDSIAALWDPRYRGKVLAYDGGTHNFSLAALKRGSATPFRIAPSDWSTLAAELIALRRNVLAFYTQPEESVRLYREGHALLVFANYGSQQVEAFRAAGLDIGYVIPREGALAWLDCWVLVAGSAVGTLAEQWINFMLEPAVSALLVSRQGLSSTLVGDSGEGAAHTLHWLLPPEDVARRNRLWQRIISGDKLSRVLAP